MQRKILKMHGKSMWSTLLGSKTDQHAKGYETYRDPSNFTEVVLRSFAEIGTGFTGQLVSMAICFSSEKTMPRCGIRPQDAHREEHRVEATNLYCRRGPSESIRQC